MKFRSILALGALGSAYYAHRRRGGELTLDSIRGSINALARWVKDQFAKVQDHAAQAEPTESGEGEPIFSTPSGFAGGDGRFPGR